MNNLNTYLKESINDDYLINSKKEKEYIPSAEKFYITDFKNWFDKTYPNLEFLESQHISDKNEQLEGKDGYFLIKDKKTQKVIKEYIQEKFYTVNKLIPNHTSIEFVNGGGKFGWGCKLEDVTWFIEFTPDSIYILKSRDKMLSFRNTCLKLYEAITKDPNYLDNVNNGRVSYDSLDGEIKNQRVRIFKEKHDKNNKNKWKVWGEVTPWFIKKFTNCEIIESFRDKGLNNYKK